MIPFKTRAKNPHRHRKHIPTGKQTLFLRWTSDTKSSKKIKDPFLTTFSKPSFLRFRSSSSQFSHLQTPRYKMSPARLASPAVSQRPPPLSQPQTTPQDDSVAHIDRYITRTLVELQSIRDTISLMANTHLDMTTIAILSDRARNISRCAIFQIKRYYHIREEGTRLSREREYTALESQEHNLVSLAMKKFLIAARYDLETKMAAMVTSKNKRLDKIQDALNEVEMMRILVLLSGESSNTY